MRGWRVTYRLVGDPLTLERQMSLERHVLTNQEVERINADPGWVGGFVEGCEVLRVESADVRFPPRK